MTMQIMNPRFSHRNAIPQANPKFDHVGVRNFLLLLLLVLVPAAVVFAGVTGKISGAVREAETGKPLVGADVIIIGKMIDGEVVPLSKSNQLGAATDQSGDYYIINISPGIYAVRFNYIGYQPLEKTDVRVLVDMTTQLDAELSSTVLDVGKSVVVTAERKQIRKDLTSSQVSLGADQIEVMPVRNVQELVKLQAGVVQDAAGNIHIRGGRSSEITYMVDGVQIIDPLNRNQGLSIDDQAIEELKTITGIFNAEYGQALSGVVNIVTKQGSNNFSVNLTGYFGDYYSTSNVYSYMNNRG